MKAIAATGLVGGAVLFAPTGATGATGSGGATGAMEESAIRVKDRVAEVFADLPAFPGEMVDTLMRATPAGDLAWLWFALAAGVVLVGLGFAVDVGLRRWGRGYFRYLYNPAPRFRREKIGYILMRAGIEAIGAIVGAAVASVGVFLVLGDSASGRLTALAIISGYLSARLIWIFLTALFGHDMPAHRMLPLSDERAVSLHRALVGAAIVSVFAISMCDWMDKLGLPADAHLLSLVLSTLLVALLFSCAAIAHRRTIGDIIAAEGEMSGGRLRVGRFILSRTWHVIAIVYFLAAWAVSAVRLLLGADNALGLVISPVAVLCGGLAVYAILLWIIDRYFGDPEATPAIADEQTEELQHGEEIVRPMVEAPGYRELAGKVAAIAVVFVGIGTLLSVWGVGVSGTVAESGWNIALVIFLAYVALEAIKTGIDRKIAEEGGPEEGEPGDEGGGTGASRLSTLLPLFRSFFLVTVGVIAALIVLSEMGVDIAPLFAGAGVVGLAIGFGAQTLIRDIFSGAFFLLDDAFRKGEYIDVGSVKGTVEKISVRSLQLRHHRGALHTIPFGEIKHLTNYSRDWVIMKLPLRLTYDTDPERVRKLIKKLGVELMDAPDIGHLFLQPLKSQGVFSMEDSAMITRVKFMTKPGDQFMVRKAVYARIRDLFEKEGIKFAHREVSVRVADLPPGQELTAEQKEAVAGAAMSAVDEGSATPAGDGR